MGKPRKPRAKTTLIRRSRYEIGSNGYPKTIRAAQKPARKLLTIEAPVQITCEKDAEGKASGPPKFSVVAYTGVPMLLQGFDLPTVIDLSGVTFGKSIVANLDHNPRQRVGHVTDSSKSDGQLTFSGVASASTPYRDEVVNSAADGFEWQASIEARVDKLVELAAGKSATVNGQSIAGPAYVVRKSMINGFGFVSHGADDNTTVKIAAKEKAMRDEVKAWVTKMLPSIDIEALSPEEVANLEADFDGRERKPPQKIDASNPFEARKAEAKRRGDIRAISDQFISRHEDDVDYIESIEKMNDHAIATGMTAAEYRMELYESMVPVAHTVPQPRSHERGLTNRVLEAAICQSGRLSGLDKSYTDQELQAAHSQFPNGISLCQLFVIAAEANGYRTSGGRVTLEVQRAAFGLGRQPMARAGQGWSTINIATIVSNTANKFLMEGWNAIDQTALRLSRVKPVNNFHTHTTVSLTDNLMFEKVGAGGEIKHGTLDELTYTSKADTYARMLAITRQDIINDDLGALTSVPRKLGNGAMKKLNDLFWTELLLLVSQNFFAAGNANINTGVATMTTAGLAATEAIFMSQTNPDGTPLAIEPRILLVPTALKSAAMTLMSSERLIDGTATAVQGDVNIWRGRFRVESSPYISNAAYTGNTAVGWWMLADPGELPLIAIAALNGRVEPFVETADADFNVLGVQMRGWSDVGVNRQEFRSAVYADGGSS